MAPAPALGITSTMMAQPLLRSLTALPLRKLTAPQLRPMTLTELPPPMKRRRLRDADVVDSMGEDPLPGGQPLGGQLPTGDQLQPRLPVLVGSSDRRLTRGQLRGRGPTRGQPRDRTD